MISRRRLLSLPIVAAFLAARCKEEEGAPGADRPVSEGADRPFLMGVSSVPSRPTDDSYRDAFKRAGEAGEVVLIQRAPPWPEFVPGAVISDRTERLTRLERDLARENKLKLFLAIDATDPGDRGRLAALPDDLRGRDFSDGRVRAAFIAYARYLALNYKPAYLALGVEVDMFFNRRGDAAFRNFQSLYFEAYDAVKSASSSTLVFPIFQFENLQALLNLGGDAVQPAWALIARFEPKLDAVAVTSFPGFAFLTVDRMPANYYGQLKTRYQKPLILASLGWSTDTTNGGVETDQATYMNKALSEAEAMAAHLVVWYLAHDLEEAPQQAFLPLAMMGLYRSDGRVKPTWSIWRTYVERPPR